MGKKGGLARGGLELTDLANIQEIYTKYIQFIYNGCLKEAKTIQSRPPMGILLNLASFRQPFYINCIYVVYISYIFFYILPNLLILTHHGLTQYDLLYLWYIFAIFLNMFAIFLPYVLPYLPIRNIQSSGRLTQAEDHLCWTRL